MGGESMRSRTLSVAAAALSRQLRRWATALQRRAAEWEPDEDARRGEYPEPRDSPPADWHRRVRRGGEVEWIDYDASEDGLIPQTPTPETPAAGMPQRLPARKRASPDVARDAARDAGRDAAPARPAAASARGERPPEGPEPPSTPARTGTAASARSDSPLQRARLVPTPPPLAPGATGVPSDEPTTPTSRAAAARAAVDEDAEPLQPPPNEPELRSPGGTPAPAQLPGPTVTDRGRRAGLRVRATPKPAEPSRAIPHPEPAGTPQGERPTPPSPPQREAPWPEIAAGLQRVGDATESLAPESRDAATVDAVVLRRRTVQRHTPGPPALAGRTATRPVAPPAPERQAMAETRPAAGPPAPPGGEAARPTDRPPGSQPQMAASGTPEIDYWPALPAPEPEAEPADTTWEAHHRAWAHRQRIDREQQGDPWSASHS